ncbi:MAG: hypothetical protein ACREVV_15315 [Steroidobacteraceae bacterium]
MKFRLKAFGFHLLGSACVLALVLSGLYFGWYRWPGWYLTGVLTVAGMLAGVDVALGPLLTLVIANPSKSRRELTRDIGMIVVVQIVALVYGTTTLWHGRPLYYAFSENMLQMVQASDLDPVEIDLARKQNPDLAPHWYSRPRWVWAPLPQDEKTRKKIITAAISGGNDVIQMPRYFKGWEEGATPLREQLKSLDQLKVYSKLEKQTLMQRMAQMGLATDKAATLPLMGRSRPLLAVFDPDTLQLRAMIRAD